MKEYDFRLHIYRNMSVKVFLDSLRYVDKFKAIKK
jgi:hypothetical protein